MGVKEISKEGYLKSNLKALPFWQLGHTVLFEHAANEEDADPTGSNACKVG